MTSGRPAGEPLFSVLVPIYRTPLRYLRLMVESVLAQTCPDFQLLLVDDGSGQPELTAELTAMAGRDARIELVVLEINAGIVGASARGLASARGTFVALVDHDDELLPEALELFRRAIEGDGELDYLYSDEAIIDPEGELLGYFRKPDFSPVRLLGQMYTGHLAVFRRSLLAELGGFREGFDGSQDYDLVLRASERARAIGHIPEALYRWRTLPTSVSHSDDNQHVFDAAQRALTEHLTRTATVAQVVQTDSTGRYRIDRPVPESVRVDVVLPDTGGRTFARGADRPALDAALHALAPVDAAPVLARDASDPDLGLVILRGRHRSGEIRLWRGQVMTVEHPHPGSPAAFNRAVAASTADYVVLVLEGLAELGETDLKRLIALAADRRIGPVGPQLVDGGGRLASAGVTFSAMTAAPIGAGCELDDPGPFGALQVDRDVLAVAPGLLVIDRSLYLSLGGLSVRMSLPAAWLDLCFKSAAVGRGAVVSAEARAVFDRPVPLPGVAGSAELAQRWRRAVARDPYWV